MKLTRDQDPVLITTPIFYLGLPEYRPTWACPPFPCLRKMLLAFLRVAIEDVELRTAGGADVKYGDYMNHLSL